MKLLSMILMGVMLLTGCRKDPNFDKLNTNLFVQTGFDTTAKFNTYKTYAISDTINFVSNLTNLNYWADSQSDSIIKNIKKHMSDSHFTILNKVDKPDLAVNVTFINNIQQTIYYDPYWWDNSFYGNMYWGYAYPFYGYATVNSFQTTALLIEIVDLKNAQANQKLNIIWSATLTGTMNKSAAENLTMILHAIDTSFAQSPYMHTI